MSRDLRPFSPFDLEGRILEAVLLDEDNIHLVAELVNGTVLYSDGIPDGLQIGFGLEADLGDYLVKSSRDLLVTDPETFDFFFNPVS